MKWAVIFFVLTILVPTSGEKVTPTDELHVQCETTTGFNLQITSIAQFNYTRNVEGITYTIVNFTKANDILNNYTIHYSNKQFVVGENSLYTENEIETSENRTFTATILPEVQLDFTEIAVVATFTFNYPTVGLSQWEGCIQWQFVLSGPTPTRSGEGKAGLLMIPTAAATSYIGGKRWKTINGDDSHIQ